MRCVLRSHSKAKHYVKTLATQECITSIADDPACTYYVACPMLCHAPVFSSARKEFEHFWFAGKHDDAGLAATQEVTALQ